jgi:hypothetical protein
MKINRLPMILIASAVLLAGCKKPGPAVVDTGTPHDTTSHASDFTSVEYWEAPFQRVMKSRLHGADGQPQGQLLLIKQFKLEMFGKNAQLQAVIKAPDCVYDTQKGLANSPNHLWVESADGKSHVEGDGFLWRGQEQFLTISNHVHTVIVNTPEQNTGL